MIAPTPNVARPRPRLEFTVQLVGLVLVWGGVLSGLFLVHQLWGSDWSASRSQNRLGAEFARAPRVPTDSADSPGPASRPSTTLASTTTTMAAVTSLESTTVAPTTPTTIVATTMAPRVDAERAAAIQQVRDAQTGDVIARLVAPSIGLDKFVVEGTGTDQLRRGPGRYAGTSILGTAGNAAIAGHRTTYGAPFGRLDELRPGDLITVDSPAGQAVYRVMTAAEAFGPYLGRTHSVGNGHIVVGPSDDWVLANLGDSRLTLTACTPRFSAKERIVVAARLITPPLTGFDPLERATAGAATPAPSRQPVPTTATPESTTSTLVPESKLGALARQLSANSVSLGDGFDGTPSEWGPTVLFFLLVLITIVTITVIAHRMGWVWAVGLGVLPLIAVAWAWFGHLDRLLPAY